MIEEKKCYKCKEIKPINEFYKNKCRKDGFKDECKICTEKYKKEYIKKNNSLIKSKAHNYYETNKEKWKENYDPKKKKIYNKLYRQNNKDRLKEYSKKYSKDYYKKNKDYVKNKVKDYANKNPEKIKLQRQNYYSNNREMFYDRAKESQIRLMKNSNVLITYKPLHKYIRRHKKNPNYCTICNNNNKKLDLACIDHYYTRNPNDYIYLCSLCHKLFDHCRKQLKEVLKQ